MSNVQVASRPAAFRCLHSGPLTEPRSHDSQLTSPALCLGRAGVREGLGPASSRSTPCSSSRSTSCSSRSKSCPEVLPCHQYFMFNQEYFMLSSTSCSAALLHEHLFLPPTRVHAFKAEILGIPLLFLFYTYYNVSYYIIIIITIS